jgi:hypothetical protein
MIPDVARPPNGRASVSGRSASNQVNLRGE